MSDLCEIDADDSKLLTFAIVRIAEFWDMTDTRLGLVLSLPASTVKRLRLKRAELDPASDGFEAAQLLLRIFLSLEVMFESDDVSMRAWLSTHNVDLAARPIDLIENREGLTAVGKYVDGHLDRV